MLGSKENASWGLQPLDRDALCYQKVSTTGLRNLVRDAFHGQQLGAVRKPTSPFRAA